MKKWCVSSGAKSNDSLNAEDTCLSKKSDNFSTISLTFSNKRFTASFLIKSTP